MNREPVEGEMVRFGAGTYRIAWVHEGKKTVGVVGLLGGITRGVLRWSTLKWNGKEWEFSLAKEGASS